VTGPESQEVYTTLALSGQDARPGATITVRDDAGNEVATTTADDSGQWQTDVGYTPPGEEDAAGGTSGGGKSLAGRMLQAALAAAQENVDEGGDGGASAGAEGASESDGSDSEGLGESDEGNSGEGESNEPGAEKDTDALLGPARTYTVTQTVPEGESEDYQGESDPKTIGPIHWRAPEVLCPAEGDTVEMHEGLFGNRWSAVHYRAPEGLGVEITVDDSHSDMKHRGSGEGGAVDECGGQAGSPDGEFGHFHDLESGDHTLTARFEGPAAGSQDVADEG